MRSSEMNIRKGCRQKIPFLLSSILLLVLVFGVSSRALAGVNLEVPIEMVDYGLESVAGTGTTNFNRSWIYLDPADYHNATYYFEIVATNTDSSPRDVYLRSTSTSTTYATITVPANTTDATRLRTASSWSPPTGKNEFLVRVSQTPTAAQLLVHSARIIVKQTNADYTRIQIPMVHRHWSNTATGPGFVDKSTSTAYGQTNPNRYCLWEKDESKYDDLTGSTWTLEAVLDHDWASGAAYAALFNTASGQVSGAEVSSSGTAIALVDASFSNSATNFSNGGFFEVRIKSNTTSYQAELRRASLYVKLTDLTKAEVLYRVAGRQNSSSATDFVYQRALVDTSLFSSPSVYFQASGWCADNADRVFLRHHGTNDSGTGGSNVSGSGINFNSGTKTLVRTSEISITDGNRFYARTENSTNNVELTSAFVVVTSEIPTGIVNESFEASGAYGYDQAGWTEVIGTGCTLDENVTPIPGTPPTGSGSECLQSIVLNTTSDDAYAYQSKTNQNVSYVQGFLYVDEEGLNDGQVLSTLGLYTTDQLRVAAIEIGQSGGSLVLRFSYWSNYDLRYSDLFTIATDTWYEVEYKYDITNLLWELKIDGLKKADGTLGSPNRTPSTMLVGVLGYHGTGGQTVLCTDLAAWDDSDWPEPNACPTPGEPDGPDPFDGETGVSANVVLDWPDCSGTDTYDVYLDETNPPTTKVASDITVSYFDPNLNWTTQYYWQVVAKHDCGNSTSGSVWTFTTGAEPEGDHFVWSGGSNQAPYNDWTTAAHSINTAITTATQNPKIGNKTVMVRAGTSITEHVIMKDGVDLMAEAGVRPTIAYSPGHFVAVVEIEGPITCNLKGFDIRAGTNMGEGITLNGTGGQVNATIEDCVVHCDNLGMGIRMLGSVNTTIKDCVIYNSAVSMRTGIGTTGWGTSDRIASGSSITIKGTTIGGSGEGMVAAGIRVRGATGASNIRVAIGGSNASDGNTISHNGDVGIILVDIDEVSIENNDVSNNGAGGIVLVDSSTVSPHVMNNTIHHQASAAGINIGGASDVTIGDGDIANANNIYANKTGIVFYIKNNSSDFGQLDPVTKTASSGTVTISGNNIFSNSYAGIGVKDGITGTVNITQNDIYSNSLSGIRMQRKCNLNVVRNTIRDNNRAGLHTGSDAADGGGFGSALGTAVLNIEKNKIYKNGTGNWGAGIDVRHASGTIRENLIYGNHRAGIRFGWENAGDPHITQITNNTVVNNGDADSGGGIVYDDLAGAVDDPPAGDPPGVLDIRNNIAAYNEKGGIRACFDNTGEERDYNLAYANNGTGETNCGYPDSLDKRCANKNFGGCGTLWNPTPPPWVILDGSHNIIEDPLFEDIRSGHEDYHLQTGSPAIDAGDDGLDMGAYGGSDPIDW
jgi:parallel beta-helix repeat protein